jgi:hypothetical protein
MMDTVDAYAVSQAWSDSELEKLCGILRNKIMAYESLREAHSDVDVIIQRCTEALQVFLNEQLLRAQERDPAIIENVARYPVGADVSVQYANEFAWQPARVVGHERGGWIQVRITSGLLAGTRTSVIQPSDIKPRAKTL